MKLVIDTLPSGAYFNQETPKDMVLLHFTAGGSAGPAIETFKNAPKQLGYPVSTHYVVDKDGTVYKLFDEKYWSYHLGITGPQAENHRHDKRSVAIEIANVGPLRQRGDQLCFWPPVTPQGLPAFKSPYCQVSEVGRFVRLPQPFRNETYFAAFPQVQADAVAELVNDICTRLSIPKALPSVENRFVFDVAGYKEFKGVTSHVNWRRDKTDLAPVQSDIIWSELVERYGFVA